MLHDATCYMPPIRRNLVLIHCVGQPRWIFHPRPFLPPSGTINNATAIDACTLPACVQHATFVYARGWCRPHCFFMKTMSCIFTTCCDRQTNRDAEMRTDTRGMQIVQRSDAEVINIHSTSLLLLQTYDGIICTS